MPWNLSRDILLPDRHPLLPRVQEQAVLQLRRDHLVKYFKGEDQTLFYYYAQICVYLNI